MITCYTVHIYSLCVSINNDTRVAFDNYLMPTHIRIFSFIDIFIANISHAFI